MKDRKGHSSVMPDSRLSTGGAGISTVQLCPVAELIRSAFAVAQTIPITSLCMPDTLSTEFTPSFAAASFRVSDKFQLPDKFCTRTHQ
jgi:hypothetical protein